MLHALRARLSDVGLRRVAGFLALSAAAAGFVAFASARPASALDVLSDTAEIVGIVFGTMVALDLVETYTHGLVHRILAKHRGLQYVLSSFVAVIPGCTGTIANVSLYRHALIGFGALAGGMIAGSGDEAFVMLATFPRTALLLFALLFVCGIGFGILADRLVPLLGIKPSAACLAQEEHKAHRGFVHYVREHVWGHVVKRHLVKTTVWTAGALIVIALFKTDDSLGREAAQHPLTLLLTAALLGIIPESGPHMVFVGMYAAGAIPFSVLFTSAFVQDGHGMLPLLSFSVRDFAWIKALNLVFGIALGLALYACGW